MKANEPLDLTKNPFGPCPNCGMGARQMFYEMMEDDNITSHVCKPKRRITIGDLLIAILFFGISFILVASIFIVIAYIREFY